MQFFSHLLKKALMENFIFYVVRSSHQISARKKAVLKNFAIFIGKQPCRNLFSIKSQA